MRLGVKMSKEHIIIFITWLIIVTTLSGIGRLLDYLLNTSLRKKEKRMIHEFFEKLYKYIDKLNFTKPQYFMVENVFSFKRKVFGEKIFTIRAFVVSLFLSQYLTIGALIIGALCDGSPLFWNPSNNGFRFVGVCPKNLIPLVPFTGFSFLSSGGIFFDLLANVGLYWNNYLFDTLSIATSLLLLRIAYEKRKYFLYIILDIIASYTFAYFCLLMYHVAPPYSSPALNFFSFIPDILNGGNAPSIIMLSYSLTTFVPTTIYMSILLFLSVLKGIKWVTATIFHDYANDRSRTPFFKLSVALGVTAFVISQAIALLFNLIKL
jgi:hypothetical protein